MSRRAIAMLAAAVIAIAGAITGLVIWLAQPSYDDIAESCMAALKERADGDRAKPEACEGLTEDDYDALLLSHIMGDLGWTDEEGRFDKNRMLEDTLNN